ncbi:MAG: PaaI family thioesterase [Deltaproteobacteria bacterium]|nr:PaaI family thioesterase [Deltaproteobacteria bacterium]
MADSVLARIEEARRTGNWRAFAEWIPYVRYLGLEVEVGEQELVTLMRFAPHLVGNASLPALHGGTLGALLESAAIFQLLREAESAFIPKTITITVDYLRPARPVDTRARAIVTRQGRRVANVRAEAWQEDRDRPVALAFGHFLVTT